MKISVVIPAYNVERFLEQAVESVFSTGYPDLEILIIEDGSKDNTLPVAQAIQAKHPTHIKLFRHKGGKNRGSGASRNVGIKAASGEVIAFLDADDCYLENRFDSCLEVIENRRDVDGVYERAIVVEQDRIQITRSTTESLSPIDIHSGDRATVMTALHHPWHTNSITMRQEVFDKVGLFNVSLNIGQDAEMWIRIAALTNLVAGTLDQPVAVYNRHAFNRYDDYFDSSPKGRVNVWIAAYYAIRRGGVEPKRLDEFRMSIMGKMVFKSNGLRQQGKAMESLKYLMWCGLRLPSVWGERRFAKECLGAVRDVVVGNRR